MNASILFIGATHGDEQFGVEVLQLLSQKRSDFDWIIGNPEAFRRGKRYYETDLNRCGQGNPAGNRYEQRRAAEIQQLASQYDYVIDLHGAAARCGIFTIVTNPTKKNLMLAGLLPAETIVIWPSITPEMKSPLSEFFPCGVEIECGDKYDQKTSAALYALVDATISRLTMQPVNTTSSGEILNLLQTKNIYRMCGDVKQQDIPPTILLEEFKEISIAEETFTPVFVGTYDYGGIVAYKLKKLSIHNIQQYVPDE